MDKDQIMEAIENMTVLELSKDNSFTEYKRYEFVTTL